MGENAFQTGNPQKKFPLQTANFPPSPNHLYVKEQVDKRFYFRRTTEIGENLDYNALVRQAATDMAALETLYRDLKGDALAVA